MELFTEHLHTYQEDKVTEPKRAARIQVDKYIILEWLSSLQQEWSGKEGLYVCNSIKNVLEFQCFFSEPEIFEPLHQTKV